MPTRATVWSVLTFPSNSGLQPTQSVANQGSSPEAGCPGFSPGFGHVDTTDFSLQPLQTLTFIQSYPLIDTCFLACHWLQHFHIAQGLATTLTITRYQCGRQGFILLKPLKPQHPPTKADSTHLSPSASTENPSFCFYLPPLFGHRTETLTRASWCLNGGGSLVLGSLAFHLTSSP